MLQPTLTEILVMGGRKAPLLGQIRPHKVSVATLRTEALMAAEKIIREIV
jgi:hypothetical protein